MKFAVMTLFPEMIEEIASHSILGRARREGLIEIEAVNIRDFSKDWQDFQNLKAEKNLHHPFTKIM